MSGHPPRRVPVRWGFDPALEIAFNDAALCATLAEAGFRNIYVAEPLLYHHESKSRGFDDTPAKVRRNLREAIYARTRFSALFRDDPCYSPNLSLQKVDEIGLPPRIVRPWRRSKPAERRILLLSCTHQFGQGVPAVLDQQAAHLREHGWNVIVGGPKKPGDFAYPGCTRVALNTPQQAAAYAVSHGVDCVVAHTPPFFSITRFLGAFPPAYFFDYGEPNPEFFAEREAREMVNWEKRFCAPLAKRVFTISQTISRQQFRDDAIVVRLGNSHLATWSPDWEPVRTAFRLKHGLQDKFVVLNVCRFREDDRLYKGVDKYIEVANDFPFLHQDFRDDVVFLIAGRGSDADADLLRSEGLVVFANVSDDEMRELYAAADLFMNFSRWEGYNLGIGQALAMGLRVIASDIEAHREFPIFTANDISVICHELARHIAGTGSHSRADAVVVDDWNTPLATMEEILRNDVDEVQAAFFERTRGALPPSS
jgi:glycosyltransferase involved in cell wall biosynthesis